jgi:hypothetical protein
MPSKNSTPFDILTPRRATEATNSSEVSESILPRFGRNAKRKNNAAKVLIPGGIMPARWGTLGKAIRAGERMRLGRTRSAWGQIVRNPVPVRLPFGTVFR